jgi:hypothetical protein
MAGKKKGRGHDLFKNLALRCVIPEYVENG